MKIHLPAFFLVAALFSVHFFVFFPDFFAPYDYATQNRELPFAPPTRLHLVDQNGYAHFRPFVYVWKQSASNLRDYEEDKGVLYPVRFLVRDAPYALGVGASRLHLFGVDAPARICLLGTDDFGRDQFSRMLYGGRISLLAGLMAASFALFIGGSLGVLSGYCGGVTDAIVMRVAELFLALPWLYLLFAIRAVLPLGIKTTHVFLLLIGVIGLVGWARPARVFRGLVLSAKERNFVSAARAMGASDLYILRRHIVPETYSTLLTMGALLVPQFVLAEVTLSFLGLGVGEPMPSLGGLLRELQKYSVLTSYWWMYLPGAALVLVFLLYHWSASELQRRFATVNG